MNRTVPLSQASVGMTLGEPAAAGNQVLLAAGTTLTTAHLAMLATRGVHTLTISVPETQRLTIDTKLVLGVDRTLRPRFVRCDLQHPALKELYRLALLRRIQLTAQGQGADHAG